MPTETTPPEDVLALARRQTTTGLVAAGRCFGLGEMASYAAYRRGDFPVRVIKVGRLLKVSTADIVAALGLTEDDRAAIG
jgi:hypothetical protein